MTYAVKNLDSDLSDLAMRMDLSDQRLMTGDVDCPGLWVLQTALRRTEAGAFFALGGHPSCVTFREPAWLIRVVEAKETVSSSTVIEEDTDKLPPELIHRMEKALSFRYPHIGATQSPSKQTATQLKGRIKDQEAAENTDEKKGIAREFRIPSFGKPAKQGKAYGSALHAAMQYIHYDACTDIVSVNDEIERLVKERLVSEEQGQMVDREKIANFFSTELGEKLRKAPDVLREFKFSILDDGSNYNPDMEGEQVLLQGVVDCALIEDDGITVIDFKTDYVTEETLPAVLARYRPQVEAYANALSRIFRMKIKSTLLYFFHTEEFVAV